MGGNADLPTEDTAAAMAASVHRAATAAGKEELVAAKAVAHGIPTSVLAAALLTARAHSSLRRADIVLTSVNRVAAAGKINRHPSRNLKAPIPGRTATRGRKRSKSRSLAASRVSTKTRRRTRPKKVKIDG